MAEMSAPPKLFGGLRLLGSVLKNVVVRLPITGTLSRPQIDRRACSARCTAAPGKAVGDLLDGGLGKELERIFGPPQNDPPQR